MCIGSVDREFQRDAYLVKLCRHILQWSQQDLAEKAGITLQTVQNIECAEGRYERKPRWRINRAFANAGLSLVNHRDVPHIGISPALYEERGLLG